MTSKMLIEKYQKEIDRLTYLIEELKNDQVPLGYLSRNRRPFYLTMQKWKDGTEFADYTYADGISLTCADYADAVRVMGNVYPSECVEARRG